MVLQYNMIETVVSMCMVSVMKSNYKKIYLTILTTICISILLLHVVAKGHLLVVVKFSKDIKNESAFLKLIKLHCENRFFARFHEYVNAISKLLFLTHNIS